MSQTITCGCGYRWRPSDDERTATFCPNCGQAVRQRRTEEGFADRPTPGPLPPRRRRFVDDDDPEYRPARRPPPRSQDFPVALVVLLLAGAGVLCLVVVGVVIGLDNAQRRTPPPVFTAAPPSVPGAEYYEDWVQRRGAPEGYLAITEGRACAEGFSARMTRRNGLLHKVEYLNGSLSPAVVAIPEGFVFGHTPVFVAPMESWFTFDYDPQGNVSVQRAFDRNGGELWALHYTSPTTAVFRDDAGAPEAPEWLGATHVRFVWSPDGWPAEIILQNADGKITPNGDGVARVRQEHDSRGFLRERTFRDADGKPVIHGRRGYAGFRTSYDNTARIRFVTTLGVDLRPLDTRQGFATMRIDYGNDGVTYSYYDDKDALVRIPAGYASLNRRYTDGHTSEEHYFDTDGKPVALRGGWCGWSATIDTDGHETEKVYLGPDNKPVRGAEGYAIVQRDYDAEGRVRETRYLDPDRQPCADQDGCARTVMKYDGEGNQTEMRYFGPDGRPVLVNGCAGWRAKYTAEDRESEREYFGIDGELRVQDFGWARVVREFDAKGHLTAQSWFGADGKPIRLKTGYARETHRFDDKDQNVETAYFGRDGKPTLNEAGVAVEKYVRDNQGRALETTYLGIDGRPCPCNDGYSKTTSRYGASQFTPVETAYFGRDGKPCLSRDWFHKHVDRYDDNGRLVESAWYGTDGKPILVAGKARIKYVNDAKGNAIETQFLGVKDELVAQADGVARSTAKFDDAGRMTEESFFGADGKPVRGADGYSRMVRKNGPEFEVLEESYFGIDGKPTACKAGYARWTATYTANERTDKMYFDAAGQPVSVRVRVFTIDGEPVAEKSGLKPGDVLAIYDGRPVTSTAAFYALREDEKRSGPSRPLVVERDGKPITLQIKPGWLDIGLEDFVPAQAAEKK